MRYNVAIEICGVCPNNLAEPYVWLASDEAPSWAVSNVIRRRALVNIGAFSSSVEEGESIAKSGVTTFQLVADDNFPLGERPIDIFTRVGAENLSASQVWGTTALAAGDNYLSVINPDGVSSAAIAAYTLLHIGTELIYSTAAHTAGNPAPFAVARGAGRTLRMPHRAAFSGYVNRTIPVTLYPVEWIGRRVIVYINGDVWKIGFLTENPSYSDGLINFSFVAAENALSVERGGDYIPPQGTTLAPTNENTPHQKWGVYFSFPALSVDIPPGASNSYRTAANICAMSSNYPEFLRPGNATVKFAELWLHYVREDLGVSFYPRAFYTYERNPWLAGEDATGPNSVELEQIKNGYFAWNGVGDSCEFTPIWDAGSTAFLSLQSSTAAAACWKLNKIRTTGFSAPNLGQTTAGAYPGAASLNYGSFLCFASSSTATSVFDLKLSEQAVTLQNNASTAAGYQNKYDAIYAGVISRRNLRSGEILNDSPNGNLFNGLPLLNVWGAYFPNQYRPCEPDRWCKFGDLYPVRPRENAPIHNVYHANGCVLEMDSWPIGRDQRSASIPCDVATAYWEKGSQQIWTVAVLPGVDASGAEVAIYWVEPDGVQLSAKATLKRNTSGDFSTYYAYKISNVVMPDGSPCVGFGSWPGQTAVQITRPIAATGALGSICARIIASCDGTSGRSYDVLGDGIGLPITPTGALSFELMSVSGVSNQYWQFSPKERPYNDFLGTALLLSGCMVVCRPEGTNYGPFCVRAGRPVAGEAVATWNDSNFIGIPVSGTDSGLVYSGYCFTAQQAGPNSDPVKTVFPDWLAADILGQGQECSVDLTGIYSRPRFLTKTALGVMVDELRDRFGVSRRRWGVKIPIDIGLNRCVGDVVSITSEHLVSANGEIGVNNALGRIVSISHDLVGGACDVELISYATYGASYAFSIDATIKSISSTTYTFEFVPSPNPEIAARQKSDWWNWKPATLNSSSSYFVYVVAGAGASGRMTGYFTSWIPNPPSQSGGTNGTAVFVRTSYTSPTPSTGSVVLIECSTTLYGNMIDAFKTGTDRLL